MRHRNALTEIAWEDAEQGLGMAMGAIHSSKISGNFGPKLNGSVRSNRKSFEKTGPPFEVVLFSRSDRSEFWLNGSRPLFQDTQEQTRTRERHHDVLQLHPNSDPLIAIARI